MVNNIIDTFSMIPYIIPGSVVGIALVISFSKAPLILTGTAAAVSSILSLFTIVSLLIFMKFSKSDITM